MFRALALFVCCLTTCGFGAPQIVTWHGLDSNRIHLIRKTADGKVVWQMDFSDWNNFTVDRDGNTLFTGNNQLLKISPEGKTLWKHPSDREPCCVATDEKGNVFRAMLIDQKNGKPLLKLVKLSPQGVVQWVSWKQLTALHKYDIWLEAMIVSGDEIRILSGLGAMATFDLDGRLVGQTPEASSAQKKAFPRHYPDKFVDRFGASVVLNIGPPYDGGYQPEIFWQWRPWPSGEKKRIVIDPVPPPAVRGYVYGGEK